MLSVNKVILNSPSLILTPLIDCISLIVTAKASNAIANKRGNGGIPAWCPFLDRQWVYILIYHPFDRMAFASVEMGRGNIINFHFLL